jgi:hypothetical protein
MIAALAGVAALAGAVAAAAPPPPTVERVSPDVVTVGSQVGVFGAAPGAERGERVVVELKRCFDGTWSVATAVEAEAAGTWAAAYLPTLNGLVRARFRGVASTPARVRVRPYVNLDVLARPIFHVEVGVGRYLPGKRVYLERLTSGTWKRVASTRLKRDHASSYAISSGRFRYRAPTGATVRAVVPGTACYMKGLSRVQQAN